ncbi:DNA ligase 6, partial [Amborella trichopoda]|uniref:DNA ligase 6 n=1 Tax=Amborella trichopoda TaxID=13333 RepID=UPI0009BE34AE
KLLKPCLLQLDNESLMASLPNSSSTETLELNSQEIFTSSYEAFSQIAARPSQPLAFKLLSQQSSLKPFPQNFPSSKRIPGTTFVIDGFRSSGPFSVTYFLSHFHSDHYCGLSPNWSRGLVFCSHITARLLIECLNLSPLFVIPLALGRTVEIDGWDVTIVDANHCPGAVQFLFKNLDCNGVLSRYLHTGDMRLSNSMKSDPILSEFIGCDVVFLDTTYCNPRFCFPAQDKSIDYVVRTIAKIRKEKVGSVLFVVSTYVVGKEKLLLEISRQCGCLLYVDSRKMSILNALDLGESDAFTVDPSATDVHVVGWNFLGEIWPYFRPNFGNLNKITVERGYHRAVGFVPTGWMYETKRDGFSVRSKNSFEIHLVPYSEHSSYNELREYVGFLRPKRVVPTVGLEDGKLDGKQVSEMQKHFAGLVDELANKQDFLMGFSKRSSLQINGDSNGEVGEKLEASLEKRIIEGKSLRLQPRVLPLMAVKSAEGSAIYLDLEKDVSLKPVVLDTIAITDSDAMNDMNMRQAIEDLRYCLPNWVTMNQMVELLTCSGGDIVEAASNFFEREIEFHEHALLEANPSENISKEVVGSPQMSSILNSTSTTEGESLKGCDLGTSKGSLLKVKSLANINFPTKKSSTPKRRGMKAENRLKKKLKSPSNPVYNDGKQSTITRFFSKVGPAVLHNSGSGEPITEQSPIDIGMVVDNVYRSYDYENELSHFLEIIDCATSREDAAVLVGKSKGDINLALEMYYSQASVEEGRLLPSASAQIGSSNVNFNGNGMSDNACLKTVSMPSLSAQGFTMANPVAKSVWLPLEKYSPVEDACWTSGEPAPYLHLARTFSLLETERGKLKVTAMLCNMFRSLLALSPDDVLQAVYLCTNKIAPDYENVELNIGGSMVSSAIKEACGTNKAKIQELYNTLGDLGDVAQACWQSQSFLALPSPLSIRHVFYTLRQISKEAGIGSADRRKKLIVNLLHSCREKEIKFLVRTLVRNMRIGASMRTVLPALAQAVVLNSSPQGALDGLKLQLQGLSAAVLEVYNILPNLDLLVPALMRERTEFSAANLSMLPGIPIRPMLSRITNGVSHALKKFEGRAFTCEYKYDGQRAQIHKLMDGSIRLFSRNGEETTCRFPDLVKIVQGSCKPTAMTFILDTEVVAVDHKNGNKILPFQHLSSRERGGNDSVVTLDSIKVDICVFIFDIMFADGKQLLNYPLRQRRQYVKDLFHNENRGYLEFAKELTVEGNEACLSSLATVVKMNSFLEDAFNSSCEGIIVKSLDVDAEYAASKRTDTWLKVKRDYVEGLNDTLDLVPIGAWHGNGRKAGWFSPFLMACYNPDTEEFQSVCRVMSGFSDTFYIEMEEFFSGDKILGRKPAYYQTADKPDFWFSTELVWEIRGADLLTLNEITCMADLTISPVHQAAFGLVHPSRGISIRFPRFIRTVTDRKPEDCTTAMDIADMFNRQTRKLDVDIDE